MQDVFFENNHYRLSFAAMPQLLKQRLQGNALQRYLELLEKVQVQPKEIYAEVLRFSSEYLHVPEVINLLTYAHIRNRKILEAEALIEKTYQDHPDYLFARINYADQCLRKRQLHKIPEIFPTFDLKKLYPDKEVFHGIEFRGFLVLMGFYQLALKNQAEAIRYYEKAKEIEPNDSSVILLEKKLFKKSLLNRFRGFFRKSQ